MYVGLDYKQVRGGVFLMGWTNPHKDSLLVGIYKVKVSGIPVENGTLDVACSIQQYDVKAGENAKATNMYVNGFSMISKNCHGGTRITRHDVGKNFPFPGAQKLLNKPKVVSVTYQVTLLAYTPGSFKVVTQLLEISPLSAVPIKPTIVPEIRGLKGAWNIGIKLFNDGKRVPQPVMYFPWLEALLKGEDNNETIAQGTGNSDSYIKSADMCDFHTILDKTKCLKI